MSILNAYVDSKRALISVDTCAHGLVGSQVIDQSKIIPLVNINAIFATRGINKFMLETFAGFFMMPNATFDAIVDMISAHADKAFAKYVDEATREGWNVEEARSCELMVVGWSKKKNGMFGVIWWRNPEDSVFKSRTLERPYLAPAAGYTAERQAPCPNTQQAMTQIAVAQVKHTRGTNPDAAIGGRLLIAELTHGTMKIKKVAHLS